MVELRSELEERVSKALLEDEGTSDADITVAEDDGVITLTGNVTDMETHDVAEEIASQVEGVLEVINDVEIVDEEEEVGGVAGIAAHPTNQ